MPPSYRCQGGLSTSQQAAAHFARLACCPAPYSVAQASPSPTLTLTLGAPALQRGCMGRSQLPPLAASCRAGAAARAGVLAPPQRCPSKAAPRPLPIIPFHPSFRPFHDTSEMAPRACLLLALCLLLGSASAAGEPCTTSQGRPGQTSGLPALLAAPGPRLNPSKAACSGNLGATWGKALPAARACCASQQLRRTSSPPCSVQLTCTPAPTPALPPPPACSPPPPAAGRWPIRHRLCRRRRPGAGLWQRICRRSGAGPGGQRHRDRW